MRVLDTKASELRGAIEENRSRRKLIYDGGKVEGKNVTYRDLVSTNIDDMKKFQQDRRGQLDKLNVLKNREKELQNQKSEILKMVPRNFHNE